MTNPKEVLEKITNNIKDFWKIYEDTNTLREEQNLFKEWLNSGATNFPEDGYDWWLNKFNQKLEEIEQEIGELETIKGSITNGFKIVVLQIIKNKKI